MALLDLTIVRGGQFDVTVPIRYARIHRLLATRPDTEMRYADLLAQVEAYIDGGTPVAEWEPASCEQFVLMACALLRSELARAEESGKKPTDVPNLLALVDWLCSFAVANDRVSHDVRGQVAAIWAGTRTGTIEASEDIEVVANTATIALAPLNLQLDDLTNQVRAQLVVHVARQHAAGAATEGALAIARRWRDNLSCVPQFADLGMAAQGLGVSLPQPVPATIASPTQVQTPAEPLEVGPQRDNGEDEKLEDAQQNTLTGSAQGIEDAEPEHDARGRGGRHRRGRFNWGRPFRDETYLIDAFAGMVDDLLPLVQELVGDKQAQKDLAFAREQYDMFMHRTGDRSTNWFLIPAIQPAAAASEALVKAGRPEQAFAVANDFGEACKVLIARSKDKQKEFQKLFERLLLAACSAAAGPPTADSPAQTNAEGEIVGLQRRLETICNHALDTYFDRSGRFSKTKFPETALAERVVNNTLAQYFDSRLSYLLNSDKPRVKDFVTTNIRVVCGIRLSQEWAAKRKGWRQKLIDKGFEELVRFIDDVMLVVDEDQLGQVSADRHEDIRRATAANDFNRVQELLQDSAKELKDYLYSEARKRLDYREPPRPQFRDKHLEKSFQSCERLSRGTDPANLKESLERARGLWQPDLGNLFLRAWVAYLLAKTLNIPAAEREMDTILKRGEERLDFTTNWNLAVLAFERQDEKRAYQFLVPLLERNEADEDLFVVIMALSLKLNDPERFLLTIPRIMNLKFHPLAFAVAHDLKDEGRAKALLGDLLKQWESHWELPHINERFLRPVDFDDTVSKAIVEGQVDQLVAWLQARIQAQRNYIPNYLALAQVLEMEKQDVPGAFRVLQDRLERERLKPPEQRRVDEACRDLLDLCKRTQHRDLGQQAYQLAKRAMANEALLRSYAVFAPKAADGPLRTPEITQTPKTPERPHITDIKDPKHAEQLLWFNASLTNVRDVASYVKEAKAFEEFAKIVEQLDPHAGVTVVEIIRNISNVIETFSRATPDQQSKRRTMYDRTIGFEKELTELLSPGVLSSRLVAVLTPYRQALERVVGDLSQQAGVSPNLQATIVNRFLSPEADQTTLVLRIDNSSERPVTDVLVDVFSESPAITVPERRERSLAKIGPKLSALLSIPVARGRNAGPNGAGEVSFGVSLRASAEGFRDHDLGIKKLRVPLRTLSAEFGFEEIPKLFKIGRPLKPSEPELFQGRTDILNKIKGSFHGGIQRESYFLDGIRRAGKTSILHFLPSFLPDNLVPVHVNFGDDFGLSGPINSASVLRDLCLAVAEQTRALGNIPQPPSLAEFQAEPRPTFDAFLASLEKVLAGRFPFLMIDEFQELLAAISRTGTEKNRDTLVLDLLRSRLENGRLNAIFTGSVRFDRLSNIMDHRIFGSITPLRVSFLPVGSVGKVLQAGMGEWVTLPEETVTRVFDLTGGYPGWCNGMVLSSSTWLTASAA